MNLFVILGALLCVFGAVLLVFAQIVIRRKIKDFENQWSGGNTDDVS